MPDWNKTYAEKIIDNATPADVLVENKQLLSTQGAALDFASGLAGNGIYLARKGYHVSAWDLSQVAVEKINAYATENKLMLNAQAYDLENNLPEIKNKFDVVVVSYFLHRESLRYLYTILKKGGMLFYQTFSGEPFQQQGPQRREFRLKPNELLTVFSDMQLLFYQEDDRRSTSANAKPGQTCFVAKK